MPTDKKSLLDDAKKALAAQEKVKAIGSQEQSKRQPDRERKPASPSCRAESLPEQVPVETRPLGQAQANNAAKPQDGKKASRRAPVPVNGEDGLQYYEPQEQSMPQAQTTSVAQTETADGERTLPARGNGKAVYMNFEELITADFPKPPCILKPVFNMGDTVMLFAKRGCAKTMFAFQEGVGDPQAHMRACL